MAFIVKKKWLKSKPGKYYEWRQSGWFLFGFIPLYIADDQPRGRRS